MTNRQKPRPQHMVFDSLSVTYQRGHNTIDALRGIDLRVEPGECVAVVGESGSGKSTLAYSALGYVGGRAHVSGSVTVEGSGFFDSSAGSAKGVLGKRITFVPQNPATSLTPTMRVGSQLAETMAVHGIGASRGDRHWRVARLLNEVEMPQPESAMTKYPHQFSGGQQQRIAIALALATDPAYIVLDEPTTGLDVTTQAGIVKMLIQLKKRRKVGMLYVSHDLRVVRELSDRVVVMYAGHMVESATTEQIFTEPLHPYTRALVSASGMSLNGESVRLEGLLRREQLPKGCALAPRCAWSEDRCFADRQQLLPAGDRLVACWKWRDLQPARGMQLTKTTSPVRDSDRGEPILNVTEVESGYRQRRAWGGSRESRVLGPISISLSSHEVLGVVGESGSGKSTLAKSIAGLVPAVSGSIELAGTVLEPMARSRSREQLRRIQLVFQNPDASLNPHQKIGDIIARPVIHFFGKRRDEARKRSAQLLEQVHLDATYADQHPRQLSGGERQRVAIARAMAAEPDVLICDEVTSALDVSVQAAIIDLLREIGVQRSLAIIFITHDLELVRSFASRTLVMYAGRLAEIGRTEAVLTSPRHPYTRDLLEAASGSVRRVDAHAAAILPSSDGQDAKGCPYVVGCNRAIGRCRDVQPTISHMQDSAGVSVSSVWCHRPITNTILAADEEQVDEGGFGEGGARTNHGRG